MAILASGTTWAAGSELSATNLNAAVNSATFASGAVDDSTTQLSGGAIIVKDGGITAAKLSSGGPTWSSGTTTTTNLTATSAVTGAIGNFGSLGATSTTSIYEVIENISTSGSALTGTVNFDFLTSAVNYYTANAAANWTLNVRGSSSTTLNSVLGNEDSVTIVVLATQGSTAYYHSALTIDGSAQTVKWAGGSAPSAGNASSIDAYTFTIIKTASATYTVLGSQTRYA
jgi:hypothetical protein